MASTLTPKSIVARDKVLSWIHSGRFAPGEKLPSEQSIGQELGVNHITVRRGLEDLSNAGLVIKRPRVGNFVAEISNQQLVTRIYVLFPDYMSSFLPAGEEGSGEVRRATHPVPGIILSQLCQAFSQRKYSITPLFYSPNRFWVDSGAVAVERDAKGVIFYPSHTVKAEEIERILDAGIKVVLLREAPQLRHLGLFYIEQDHGTALSQILDKLLKLGHRNIAMVRFTERPDAQVLDDIATHYFKSAGITDYEKNNFDLSNRDPADYGALDKIFDRGENFPTAVVVPDGYVAWEFFSRCYERNIRIPRDISIAALANSNPHVLPFGLSAPDSVAGHIRSANFVADKLSCLLDGEELVERCMHLKNDVVFTKSISSPRKDKPSWLTN